MMRLVSAAVLATLLLSSAAQARTVNPEAEATSALLMILAYAHHGAPAAASGHCVDLSRSPQQIRRTAMRAKADRPAPWALASAKLAAH